MVFLLENIVCNSNEKEFKRFKQRFPFIPSMQIEMEKMWNNLAQQTNKAMIQKIRKAIKPKLEQQQFSKESLEAYIRTVLYYGDFDVCRLADKNII